MQTSLLIIKMSVNLKMEGVNLSATLAQQQHLAIQLFRRYSYEMGKEMEKDIKTKMTTAPKTGNLYPVSVGVTGALKSPKLVRASAGDEYPAVRTGKLRKSVGFQVQGKSTLIIGAGNAEVNYADYLEKGTSKITPRNYLKNTIKSILPVRVKKLEQDIKELFAKVIKY